MVDKYSQPCIDDFIDENIKPPIRKKLHRKYLRAKARSCLEEFFQLFLESLGKNSIEVQRVSAYMNDAMKKMEEKGIFYMKTMKNGRAKIFKKLYCCLGLNVWKKCPEYSCLIWPCDENSTCPYDPYHNEETHLIVDVEITNFDNSKQEKQLDADEKEKAE